MIPLILTFSFNFLLNQPSELLDSHRRTFRNILLIMFSTNPKLIENVCLWFFFPLPTQNSKFCIFLAVVFLLFTEHHNQTQKALHGFVKGLKAIPAPNWKARNHCGKIQQHEIIIIQSTEWYRASPWLLSVDLKLKQRIDIPYTASLI